MPEIFGIDHSGKIIEQVTSRLSEKGILVDRVEQSGDDHKMFVMGMGNQRKATALVPKQEQELTPEELESQSAGFVEDIEAQLRSGEGSWE